MKQYQEPESEKTQNWENHDLHKVYFDVADMASRDVHLLDIMSSNRPEHRKPKRYHSRKRSLDLKERRQDSELSFDDHVRSLIFSK